MNETNISYGFIPVPTNLYLCLDNNCRSTLSSLIQLSSFYASDSGWFFRTNSDLQAETKLSKNVLGGALDALYTKGLIDIIPQVKGSQEARKYKVNFDTFSDYEKLSVEDCMKNPDYAIETCDYKHGAPSFQHQPPRTSPPTIEQPQLQAPLQNDNYIENIEETENEDNRIVIDEHEPTPTSISSFNSCGSVSKVNLCPNKGGSIEKPITPTAEGNQGKPSESNPMINTSTTTSTTANDGFCGTEEYNLSEELTTPLRAALDILEDYDVHHKPFDDISWKALGDATKLWMAVFNCDFKAAKHNIQAYRKESVEIAKKEAETAKGASMPRPEQREEKQPIDEKIANMFINDTDEDDLDWV